MFNYLFIYFDWSQADLHAQQLIGTGLMQVFGKDLAILGEEDEDVDIRHVAITQSPEPLLSSLSGISIPAEYVDMDYKDVQVFVDPLDGTREYITDKKSAEEAATVLIGVCLKGKPVGGVITRAFTGETLYGIVGVGWFCENMAAEKVQELIQLRDTRSLTRRVVATTKSHGDAKLESYLVSVQPSEVKRSGGCGGKIFLMLEGKVDAYCFPKSGTKTWDTCAPEAILQAYGGELTQPNGQRISYERAEDGGRAADVHLNVTGLVASFRGQRDAEGLDYHRSFCKL